MKRKVPSQEHIDKVNLSIHRITITMTLVILVLGIMILPSSSTDSAAFVPLILSMVISFCMFILACISLRKEVKKELRRKAEMGPYVHRVNADAQDAESFEKDM